MRKGKEVLRFGKGQRYKDVMQRQLQVLRHGSTEKPTPAFITTLFRLLSSERSPTIKMTCLDVLHRNAPNDKRIMPTLKRHLFDIDSSARTFCAVTLAERIGWRNVLVLINSRAGMLKRVPKKFYDSGPANPEEVSLLYYARKRGIKKMLNINRKPFLLHGVPVFLAELLGDYIGYNLNGLLLVESNPEKLKPQFREATAWHEFGETFGHLCGTAFELDYLKKTNTLQAFLAEFPGKKGGFERAEQLWEAPHA